MANSTTLYTLPDGRRAVDVSEAKALTIADQGIVQNVITDGIEVSLPSTVVGYHYTIRNGGDSPAGAPVGSGSNKSMEVTVVPAASDLIAGLAFTASDNDKIRNTQTTAHVGDELSVAGNGTTGWNITGSKGIWAQIAVAD